MCSIVLLMVQVRYVWCSVFYLRSLYHIQILFLSCSLTCYAFSFYLSLFALVFGRRPSFYNHKFKGAKYWANSSVCTRNESRTLTLTNAYHSISVFIRAHCGISECVYHIYIFAILQLNFESNSQILLGGASVACSVCVFFPSVCMSALKRHTLVASSC